MLFELIASSFNPMYKLWVKQAYTQKNEILGLYMFILLLMFLTTNLQQKYTFQTLFSFLEKSELLEKICVTCFLITIMVFLKLISISVINFVIEQAVKVTKLFFGFDANQNTKVITKQNYS